MTALHVGKKKKKNNMPRVDMMQEPYYSTTGYPTFSHHHGSFQGHHGYRSHVRSPVSSMGRSTPDSDDYCTQNNKFKMRWILSLGLLLPALAAVIGKSYHLHPLLEKHHHHHHLSSLPRVRCGRMGRER